VLADLREADLPPTQGNYAGLLPSIPEGSNYQYLTARGGGEELFGYRTRYWSFLLKLAKDLPAWTLAASPGPSTGPGSAFLVSL
jgi:DNA (cytosine-5)-methyltransferase 1